MVRFNHCHANDVRGINRFRSGWNPSRSAVSERRRQQTELKRSEEIQTKNVGAFRLLPFNFVRRNGTTLIGPRFGGVFVSHMPSGVIVLPDR
jgi:hypothetical protein